MRKHITQSPKTPVDAVQQVYTALEPFDDQARKRIIESVVSLLGMRTGVLPIDVQRRTTASTISASPEQVDRPATSRPLSPRELIQEKQPTTNAQRIALYVSRRGRHDR